MLVSMERADEVIFCLAKGNAAARQYADCRARLAGAARPRLFLARSRAEAEEHVRNSDGDPIPPRRIWIGQGTNTWKSDLNLSVEYVRTTGPADAPGASLGIPWMAGIPGTVGGWIKMNAGAFGHSISGVLAEVKVDGRWIPASACGFAYRHSDIVGEIQDFKLKGESSTVRLSTSATAEDFLAKRRRFPSGTYGSFFKNPPGDFAGRLLEEAGAKDLRVGGASVWSEHANVIVRGDGATASDVLALAVLMREAVRTRFGVALEPEVQGIEFGEEGT